MLLSQCARMAFRYDRVWYFTAKFLSQASLNQIFLAVGELRSRIAAGLLMRKAFAGYKSTLSHARIRTYAADFGY